MTLRNLVLTVLCLVTCAHAQGPRMTIRGTDTILAIHTASITIHTSTSGIAETEMLLTFRNDTDLAVEAEFTLPLPPGATISNYALEVNGSLREAVAVEKERALFAYETIKRQMIDPGIVERQAGNTYRTRVYPVPANGTKQLRIGYVEVLPAGPNSYTYQCPLRFSPAPAKTTITIHGPPPRWNGNPNLTFTSTPAQPDTHFLTLENTAISGNIEITPPHPATPQLHAEPGKSPHFLWSGTFPDIPEKSRPAPKNILLFWDASDSSSTRKPDRELALLGQWFASLPDITVDLRLLRNHSTPGGIHPVTNGNWTSLRKAIESAHHDGSTSLADLTDSDADADLVIYCGDGQATASPLIGLVSKPLILLHTGTHNPATALSEASQRTGGTIIPVDRTEIPDALRLLTLQPFRVISINGSHDLVHLLGQSTPTPGKPLRLIGQWTDGPLPELEIAFGTGTEIHTRLKSPAPTLTSKQTIRRLHAQHTLTTLEAAPQPDHKAILAHCITHHLASDLTSLIVLERFEDHLRYEIPPPEPELRKQYDEKLQQRTPITSPFPGAWNRRLHQHQQNHHGHEIILLPRVKQIHIWKNAVTSVFEPHHIDPRAFSTISGWHHRALTIIERRDKLRTADEFQQWRESLTALDQEGRTLAATPIQPPPPGKPLAVSVRGLIRNPGVILADQDLTLLKAIDLAGGHILTEKPENVALYRNAGKTLYNVRSRQFKDFNLLPADMLVLEPNIPFGDSSDVDPFAAPSPTPRLEDQPPIVQQHDIWVSPNSSQPAGGGNSPASPQGPSSTPGIIKLFDHSDHTLPDLTNFSAKIATRADPLAAYLELKAGRNFAPRFHIEVARILYQHGHDTLAATILSTLIERGQGTLPSRLAEAFWLAEFGKTQTADDHLAQINDPQHNHLIAFARSTITTDPAAAIRHFDNAIDLLGKRTSFNLIALTELNRHPANLRPARRGLDHPLPCDLRITIQSSQPALTPDITIIDPLGDPVSLHTPTSPTGGLLTHTHGLAEFTIRRAVPGTYTLRAKSPVTTTLRIAIHTHWNHPTQKTLHHTHLLDPTPNPTTLTTLDFAFTPSTRNPTADSKNTD